MTDQPPAPAAALRRIAFLLERGREPTYKVRAFRRAAAAVDGTDPAELERLAAAPAPGLRGLPGIGEVTERVIREALAGEVPVYLRRLEAIEGQPVPEGAAALRQALRGDCHSHSTWSDGGSPIAEMAEAARDLGHEYLVLTDHSPRLTVANGLSPERLLAQLEEVARLNDELAPFRVLTGIEVDILEDGTLDQDEELLADLDVVVASVHSKLRMPSGPMTDRMVAAMANPNADILGHCTGRIVVGRGRPESTFDSELVFAACAHFGKAVEVNCRPERLDPPRRMLAQIAAVDVLVTIDTDAHAIGQLDWQPYGCARVADAGLTPESVVNAWEVERLLAWTRAHRAGSPAPVPGG